MFGLQGPEAQTKQNPRLKGPHDSQGQGGRQTKPQHPRTTRKRVGECIWWEPRNKSQLFSSYSSPDIFVFTLYVTNTFLLYKPSPMNIPITELTILSWFLYCQQMEKVKVFPITHLSRGRRDGRVRLSYKYAFGIFLESLRYRNICEHSFWAVSCQCHELNYYRPV